MDATAPLAQRNPQVVSAPSPRKQSPMTSPNRTIQERARLAYAAWCIEHSGQAPDFDSGFPEWYFLPESERAAWFAVATALSPAPQTLREGESV